MRLNELEIKIALDSDKEELYKRCIEGFGEPLTHFTEFDAYFDTPDGLLDAQDLVVRIRSNGNKQTIALKSPRVEFPGGMTHRIELEFIAAEGEKVREQLFNQGLQPNDQAKRNVGHLLLKIAKSFLIGSHSLAHLLRLKALP